MGIASAIFRAVGMGASAATGEELQKQVSAVATAMAAILDSRVDIDNPRLDRRWTAAWIFLLLESRWDSIRIFSLVPGFRSWYAVTLVKAELVCLRMASSVVHL